MANWHRNLQQHRYQRLPHSRPSIPQASGVLKEPINHWPLRPNITQFCPADLYLGIMPLLMEFTAKLSSYHRHHRRLSPKSVKPRKSPTTKVWSKLGTLWHPAQALSENALASFSASTAGCCAVLPDSSGLERTLALNKEVLDNGAGQTASSILQNGVGWGNDLPLNNSKSILLNMRDMGKNTLRPVPSNWQHLWLYELQNPACHTHTHKCKVESKAAARDPHGWPSSLSARDSHLRMQLLWRIIDFWYLPGSAWKVQKKTQTLLAAAPFSVLPLQLLAAWTLHPFSSSHKGFQVWC